MLQVAQLAPNLLAEATPRVVDFLEGQLNGDGGAADRSGKSDLYYTAFVLDGLLALGAELPGGRVREYLAGFADGRHVTYDAISASAVLDAHAETFGRRMLPHYRFERARVIAAFDADFLGTWLSPGEFTRGYRAGRSLAEGGALMSAANAAATQGPQALLTFVATQISSLREE